MKLLENMRSWLGAAGLLVGALSTGCFSPDAQFTANEVYLVKKERDSRSAIPVERRQEIATVLIGMFGTPDDPEVPSLGELDLSAVIDLKKLKLSAGPVGSDETGRGVGLYREHCAHCHGVTGDGAGPTAEFLNPYPRDYRSGTFKFKSTPKGARPTHDDLRRILINGISGTAMPSFKMLPENEIDSLIHYLRYLSIRGEVERLLIDYVASELDPKDPMFSIGSSPDSPENAALKSFAVEVAQKWVDAEGQAVEIPPPDPQRNLQQSVARGKELFYGPIANCIKCHGDSALGDGQTNDFDDWTKELDPANEEAVAAFVHAGALQPRNIRPRNLRLGAYRGGRRPIDLFWRLRLGIEGTPMPAVPLKPDDAGPEIKGLTTADIWSLVDYIRSLPQDSLSEPSMPETLVNRERL